MTSAVPVKFSWQESRADAYWGRSIPWNHYLKTCVFLMNHACCRAKWGQEGISATFNADLSYPAEWSAPTKILSKVQPSSR
jgi:hypothetical protein